MKRREFRKLFIELLNKEFNIKVYFHDTKTIYDLDKTKYNGMVWAVDENNATIMTISWQKNYFDILQTLFHEIAHSELHICGKYSGKTTVAELEAELVAQLACKLLQISYNNSYLQKLKSESIKNSYRRMELVKKCATKIYSTIKNNIYENSENVKKLIES